MKEALDSETERAKINNQFLKNFVGILRDESRIFSVLNVDQMYKNSRIPLPLLIRQDRKAKFTVESHLRKLLIKQARTMTQVFVTNTAEMVAQGATDSTEAVLMAAAPMYYELAASVSGDDLPQGYAAESRDGILLSAVLSDGTSSGLRSLIKNLE